MAIVFNTPKSALNTTSGAIQIKNGDNLQEKSVTYNQEGEFTVVPDPGMYGLSKVDITIDVPSDVHNQTATVDPSTNQQVVEPEEGYTGLSSVTVNAVTSAIDQNIAAGNIKKDVSILGVTGSYDPQPNLSNLNITPSTNAQEYNPAISGVDGYSLVRVSAVTSAIDQNITAGNIKNGVSILGVTGSYDPQPNLQSKNATPSTSSQTIQPDNGYDGLSSVSIAAVTAAIDANIQSANILDGVTILGVTGSDLGYNAGYQTGYDEGYAEGQSSCAGMDVSNYEPEITTNKKYTMAFYSPEPWEITMEDNAQRSVSTKSKSGAKAPVPSEPTLFVEPMSGDAGTYNLEIYSTEDQVKDFTIEGENELLTVSVRSVANYFKILPGEDNIDITFLSHWSNNDAVNPINIEYSDDLGETWTLMELEQGTSSYANWYLYTISDVSSDTELWFRGNNSQLGMSTISSGQTSFFISTGEVTVEGNLGSLLNKENFNDMQLYSEYTFCGLLGARNIGGNMTGLQITDAAGLILPKPYKHSYEDLFFYCDTLIEGPELPFTAMYEACYQEMFSGCTSLEVAPQLPSMLLAPNCYYSMFNGCSSLLEAPELPAINTESYCYALMFVDCTSIESAPILPAKVVARSAYQSMFEGCSNLSTVTCLATSLGQAGTYNWLNGVAAEGTFYKDANMNNWTLDSANGVPSGWTVEDYVA